MKWVWIVIGGALAANFAATFALKNSKVDQVLLPVPAKFGEVVYASFEKIQGSEAQGTEKDEVQIEFRVREKGSSRPVAGAEIVIENFTGMPEKTVADASGISKRKLHQGTKFAYYVFHPGFEIESEELELSKEAGIKKKIIFVNLKKL